MGHRANETAYMLSVQTSTTLEPQGMLGLQLGLRITEKSQ